MVASATSTCPVTAVSVGIYPVCMASIIAHFGLAVKRSPCQTVWVKILLKEGTKSNS